MSLSHHSLHLYNHIDNTGAVDIIGGSGHVRYIVSNDNVKVNLNDDSNLMVRFALRWKM